VIREKILSDNQVCVFVFVCVCVCVCVRVHDDDGHEHVCMPILARAEGKSAGEWGGRWMGEGVEQTSGIRRA